MVPNRVRLSTALLVLLVLIAGCSGAGGGVQSGGDGGEVVDGGGAGGGMMTGVPEATGTPAPTPAPEREAAGGGDGGASGGQALPAGRAIIKNGRVSLEVDDFDAARRNVSDIAADLGGYVSDSHEEHHRIDNRTWTTGALTIRVPSEDFDAAMERISAQGEVQEANTDTQDVTDQLVDIEARLSNLRAQRDQLRELYRRANTTEDVLAVQDRLTRVQTEIERLEARKQALEGRVAMSTIHVQLREPRPDPVPDPIEKWYDIPLVKAFLDSVHGVTVVARALAVALAYALPYLIAFGIPIAAIAAAYLAWRRGRLPELPFRGPG